jgi:excinuclease UvrABC nuclease subunit
MINIEKLKLSSYSVYCLKDPFTLKLCYVGITSDIKRRKRVHYTHKESVNSLVGEWIKNLKNTGQVPKFEIMTTGLSYEKAFELEKKIIKRVRPLYNILHNHE